MHTPYKWLAGLLALVTGTAAATTDRDAVPGQRYTPADLEGDPSISRTIVKRFFADGSWMLAQHRSHRSHSSHRSHFSSSASPPVVSPRPAPPRATAPPPSTTTPAPSVSPLAGSEAERLAIRVQLALNSRGYCSCEVDGVYGGETRDALKRFQKDNGLPETGVPSFETLQKLGIVL